MFAEDNAIFERQQFKELVELRSAEDGSDLAALLANLFQVLDTPPLKRLKNLDEQLAAFAYINGKLFEERLPVRTAPADAAVHQVERKMGCTGAMPRSRGIAGIDRECNALHHPHRTLTQCG